MNYEPHVSVIIPVFNAENYIQQCIDSLRDQTLKNIEFIFVDDKSTDNSLNILRQNAHEDTRIKVIELPENVRQGGARNAGICAARSNLIGFVDADDFVSPTMFENLFNAIVESQVDVAYIRSEVVNMNDQYEKKKAIDGGGEAFVNWSEEFCALNYKSVLTDKDREILITASKGGVWCALWKREIIEKNQIWFPEHLRYEDNYWGSLICAYVEKIALVNKSGYYYRINSNSTIHSRNQDYLYDRIIIENQLLSDTQSRGLFEKYYPAWEYIYISRYFLNTYYAMLSLNDQIDIAVLQSIVHDVRTHFPRWTHSQFIRDHLSKKRILMAYAAYNAPRLTAIIAHCLYKLRNSIRRSL